MARHTDLPKSSRFGVLASICVVIAALYFGRIFLIPVALAVLLAFVLSPLVHQLERLSLPRVVATMLVVTIAVAAVGFAGYLVYHQAITLITDLPKYRTQLATKIGGIRSHGGFLGKAENEIKAIDRSSKAATQPTTRPTTAQSVATSNGSEGTTTAPGAIPGEPATQPTAENPLPVRIISNTSPLETLRDYGAQILDPLATTGLVLVFVIFMLINREDLRDRMIRLVGHGRLNLTTQAFDEAGTRISKYLSALSIVNGTYGVFVALGLWVIGHFLGHGESFPNVLIFGILVGVCRFVPYIGIWIGAAVPLLLSFALFPGYGAFFATLGLFVLLEVIVSQFVEPYWYGASTGMSALAVLVAAVFWTWLWGPIGLLLSTPLTVCLVVMGKYVPQLQFLDILLGDEPVLEPPVRVYQRLIAEDPEEATDLANEYLDEQPLEQVFDRIMIPALSLAEHDRHRGRLDGERYLAVLQGLRDIVEELADRRRTEIAKEKAKAGEPAPAIDEAKASREARQQRLPFLPQGCKINILCLPARAEADEIVAMMLSQLLQIRGYCATFANSDVLTAEMVDLVENRNSDLVFISAMPPSAVTHSRYVYKRLRQKFDELRLVVGLWTLRGDAGRARDRIAPDEDLPVVTSLAAAQDRVDELTHPLIAGRLAPEPAAPQTRPANPAEVPSSGV